MRPTFINMGIIPGKSRSCSSHASCAIDSSSSPVCKEHVLVCGYRNEELYSSVAVATHLFARNLSGHRRAVL